MFLSLLVICSGLAAGSIERGEAVFRPTAEEVSIPEPFRMTEQRFTYEIEPVLDRPHYQVSLVRFPSPVVTPDVENNTVHAEYFAPVGGSGRRPAVVVLHILGPDFPLSRYMAARLADRGIGALFVKLPYYGERRPLSGPGPVPTKFLSADLERTMRSMRQGICDVRRALAWLASRPEVDAGQLGVTGISLGGIVASVVTAIDPAATRGVFLLAGGDLSRILWEMPETAKFRESWEQSGRTIKDLEALTRPYDPLTHAHRLKGKRVLIIAGKIDEVVPPESTQALWERAGRPPILWYDCGHYSAIGYLLPGIRRTIEFLETEPKPGS